MSIDYLFNCLILGDQKVGKTSILSKWFNDNFDDSSKLFCKDFFSKIILVKEKKIKLRIFDPLSIRPTGLYYRYKCAIILVLDLTDGQSYDRLNFWVQNIKDMMDNDPLIILIGNKADLVKQRSELIEQYAIMNQIHYVEISAKTDKKKIDGVFEAKEILLRIESNTIGSHGIIKGSDQLKIGCHDTYFDNALNEFNIVYCDPNSGKLVRIRPNPPNNQSCC